MPVKIILCRNKRHRGITTCTVTSHLDKFDSWQHTNNVKEIYGTIRFYSESGISSTSVRLKMVNKLLYITQEVYSRIYHAVIMTANTQIHDAVINCSKAYESYELWHHRFGHPGEKLMNDIGKPITGTPNLWHKHRFFKYPCCQDRKMTKMIQGHKSVQTAKIPGNVFLMDFGFMRGPKQGNDKKGKILSSFDSFTLYLLVTNEASRFVWIFLTKDKNPPIDIVGTFLDQKGLKSGMRRVRIDKGGELAKSSAFRNLIQKQTYILKITGSDTSFQNSLSERLHRTFVDTMRTMLQAACLTNMYRSYALLHAVYLKNRLPRKAVKILHMRCIRY